MTATLTGFDGTTHEITLRCDLMPLAAVGDTWLLHPEQDRCEWAEDWEGNFDTGCGRKTCGMEDGRSMADHGIAFCCYCGRLITAKSYVETQDEE